MPHTDTYRRALGGGLTLRSVADRDDVERVAEFDALIHGAGTAPTWRAWMTEHPHANPGGWLLIEEDATRRVVASLCLFPLRLHYGGVELRSAEMGVVGTLKEYRGRGLQRALNERYAELLAAGGFHLSHIQGIAYFYRQFGYEYAAPLEAWWRLQPYMVPDAAEPAHACRPATGADLPALVRFSDAAAAALDIATLRDEAVWRYLLGPSMETEMAAETWVVCGPGGAAEGYFRVARHGFGEGLIVAEASPMGPGACMAALRTIRDLTLERGLPYIRMNLPDDAALVRAARGLGAYDGGAYAWQIRVPDPAHLLRAIGPVLERRLAASMFAGLTETLRISLYRSAVTLRFAEGRLVAAEPAPPGGPAELRLPPTLLAPLVLGYRSLDEMRVMYPDASADGPARELVGTLFPKMRAFLFQQY